MVEDETLEPGIITIKNAVYIPGNYALYGEDGGLIAETCQSFFRPVPWVPPETLSILAARQSQKVPSKIDLPKITSVIDQQLVLISSAVHFGHFLMEGMSRLWALPQLGHDIKLIMPCPERLDTYFERSFVRDLLHPLGISKSSFIEPLGPTLLRDVIVPLPSVNYSYAMYHQHRLPHVSIGERTAPGRIFRNGSPIYISRTALGRGRELSGEELLEEQMRSAGFAIVHPEKLSIADQIHLFASSNLVVGASGSAMHLILFEPEDRIRQRVILASRIGNERFLMIDRIKARSHQTTYINCIDMVSTAENKRPTWHLDANRAIRSLKKSGII